MSILLWKGFFSSRNSVTLKHFYLFMKDLIHAHKKLIKTVKEQMGFSDYGMYWLAYLEGGLTIWLLDRIFFHWLKF